MSCIWKFVILSLRCSVVMIHSYYCNAAVSLRFHARIPGGFADLNKGGHEKSLSYDARQLRKRVAHRNGLSRSLEVPRKVHVCVNEGVIGMARDCVILRLCNNFCRIR